MAVAPLSESPPDPVAVTHFLHRVLSRNLSPEMMAWLEVEIERQKAGLDERQLATALGLAGRKLGRLNLIVSDEEIAAANGLRRGWQPQFWATDEVARCALLLATYRGDNQAFAARLDRLCARADVAELIAYLKGFAVFPAAKALHERAREGARSSIKPVFEAIACRNPYPFDHFDTAVWNQMVVKCVFTGAVIETVWGLEERRNPELIIMLQDLVEERRIAGRQSPEGVHRYIAGAL